MNTPKSITSAAGYRQHCIENNVVSSQNPIRYEGYLIVQDGSYFTFVHEDYDGAPDAHDRRHGLANSIMECIAQINEQLLDIP